jgi:hypothetical protein
MRAILILLFLLSCRMAQAQNDTALKVYNGPIASFSHTEWDFGKVKTDSLAEHIFTFTNTGKAPLIITRAQSSGSCAIVSGYTKEPVMPGKQGEVKIIMRCSGGPGPVRKQFTIHFNNSDIVTVLEIKAMLVNEEIVPAATPSGK